MTSLKREDIARQVSQLEPCTNKKFPKCEKCKYREPKDADYSCMDLCIADLFLKLLAEQKTKQVRIRYDN